MRRPGLWKSSDNIFHENLTVPNIPPSPAGRFWLHGTKEIFMKYIVRRFAEVIGFAITYSVDKYG